MTQHLDLRWEPPGPVAARFMASGARVPILNGPIGSGKTTACLMKALRLSSRQKRSTRDGLRKFKLCVVRDTYRQLWKTTLPSWFKRVPREFGSFSGADNAPARHEVMMHLGDGSTSHLTVEFVAIGENAVEDVLRGYEPTAFYLNELDLLSRDVLTYARGRIGRFPDVEEGGPSWYGIIADCNAPELNSWLYQDIFTKGPEELEREGAALFRQPSGLSPAAENLKNLVPGYYVDQVRGAEAWYVARMVENKPGYSRAGKPIYPEFSDVMHVAAEELAPMMGIALEVGLDAGLNPAAVMCQHLPDGQWRVIDELVGETGTGAARFGKALGQRLKERFGMIRTIHGWADPSAAFGADKQAGERTWIEIVAAEAGIRVSAAPTNRLIPRTRGGAPAARAPDRRQARAAAQPAVQAAAAGVQRRLPLPEDRRERGPLRRAARQERVLSPARRAAIRTLGRRRGRRYRRPEAATVGGADPRPARPRLGPVHRPGAPLKIFPLGDGHGRSGCASLRGFERPGRLLARILRKLPVLRAEPRGARAGTRGPGGRLLDGGDVSAVSGDDPQGRHELVRRVEGCGATGGDEAVIQVGTRSRANQLHNEPPGTSMTRGFSRDVGMSKLATASMTFGSGEVSAANGTFPSFVVGDLVLVEGVNLNNGYFTVTAIDGTNHSFLTLSPAPKAEGPLTATVRTA